MVTSSEYKKRNITIWNEIAPRYHKKWASSETGPFESTKKLLQLVSPKKGNRVLDIACGTGTVTKRLSEKAGQTGFVIGVDTSITAIKIAKKWNGRKANLQFINADAENFSFKEKFDIITCQYGLFFFPNALKVLKNMRKSLKDHGVLGISVHGKKEKVPFFGSILDAVTKFIPDYIPPGTPSFDRFSTKKTLRDEVKKAGFSSTFIKDFVFKHNPGDFETYWRNYLQYIAKPLREKLYSLDRSEREELKEIVRQNTKPYTKRNETIEFPWQVLILTARN